MPLTSSRFCNACGGAAHPASGCQYSPTMLICGPCTRRAWVWIREHTRDRNKRVGPKGSRVRVSFYEAAGRNPPTPRPPTERTGT